jgi:uncharacterized protein involved in type VI secretion and phage assembly
VTSAPPKFFGKHRGTVVNNVDPLQIGRIQVSVPGVSVIPGSWAMPCFPVTGIQTGVFTVPLVGAGVWVEFESGDPDFPIWTGGFFGSAAEVPAMSRLIPPAVPGFTFQTPLQNGISISDVPGPSGGIVLKTTTGAMILVNDVGITISNGKGATIVLAGPSVTINQGALVVV